MFAEQVEKQDGRAVFLEYAWDMGWCDPCAADPLSTDELRRLGVFWDDAAGGAPNVFLTRLHVRYDGAHFPEDLVFQETADRRTSRRAVLPPAGRGGAGGGGGGRHRGGERGGGGGGGGAPPSPAGGPPGGPEEEGGRPRRPVQPAAWWERIWKR